MKTSTKNYFSGIVPPGKRKSNTFWYAFTFMFWGLIFMPELLLAAVPYEQPVASSYWYPCWTNNSNCNFYANYEETDPVIIANTDSQGDNFITFSFFVNGTWEDQKWPTYYHFHERLEEMTAWADINGLKTQLFTVRYGVFGLTSVIANNGNVWAYSEKVIANNNKYGKSAKRLIVKWDIPIDYADGTSKYEGCNISNFEFKGKWTYRKYSRGINQDFNWNNPATIHYMNFTLKSASNTAKTHSIMDFRQGTNNSFTFERSSPKTLKITGTGDFVSNAYAANSIKFYNLYFLGQINTFSAKSGTVPMTRSNNKNIGETVTWDSDIRIFDSNNNFVWMVRGGEQNKRQYDNLYVPGIPSPKDVQVSFNIKDKKASLKWKLSDNAADDAFREGKFYVFRKIKGQNDNTATRLGAIDLMSNKNYQYEYTDESIEYENQYTYSVVFYYGKWTGTPSQPNGNVEDLTVSYDISTIRDIKLSEVKAKPSENKITLEWTTMDLKNDATYKVLRKKGSEQNPIEIYSGNLGSGLNHTWTDANPGTMCEINEYTIVVSAYNTTFETVPVQSSITGSTKISSYKATKGEYANSVRLTWEVSKVGSELELYTISRRQAGTNDVMKKLYSIRSIDRTFIYTDDKALPGLYYEYEFKVETECEDGGSTGSLVDTHNDVGFSQATGTVAGRITFGNGTAVDNATVLLARDENDTSESKSMSLFFAGNGGEAKWTTDNEYNISVFEQDFTIQMWLKPMPANSTNDMGVLSLDNALEIYLKQTEGDSYKPVAVVKNGDQEVTFDVTLTKDMFNHLSFSKSGNTIIATVINKEDTVRIQSDTRTIMTPLLEVGLNSEALRVGLASNAVFRGSIDEFRVWSKALTESDISNNFDRLLAGNDANLITYWPFDEGLDKNIFDISRKGSVYNEHHGVLVGDVVSGTDVPGSNQLGLKAYTDSDGNYLLRGVPFTGDGTSYAVVPSKGTHSFNPQKQLRFVSASSLVHNGTDFIDISSFRVKGKVTFEGGNYPVKGVGVYIDGSAVVKDGGIVETGTDGIFEVDVPIGSHYISVAKQGHNYANNGRYPQTGTYNFQKNITDPILFTDSTFVRLAGRIVGGQIEGDKPLGFRKSKATIGKATIVLTQEELADSEGKPIIGNIGETEGRFTLHNDSINSRTFIKEKQITITSDSLTGEFLALVPPLNYTVSSYNTNSVSHQDFRKGSDTKETIELNAINEQSDTLTIDGVQREFKYHNSLVRTYRSDPKIKVVDLDHESDGLLGEYNYEYKVTKDETDKIPLIKDGTYSLGHPVFFKDSRYAFEIYGYEEYLNKDKAVADTSEVPLASNALEINNKAASTSVDLATKELTVETTSLVLDEKGKYKYIFTGGFPNLTDNTHLLGLNIKISGTDASWPLKVEEKEVYILGDIPENGNPFVTKGPDLVDFILRDPGGSGSYSFLETGSTITNTRTVKSAQDNDATIKTTVKLGGEVSFSMGAFGVSTIINTKKHLDITAGGNNHYNKSNENTTTTSSVFTRRIQTSDSPDYVGGMGDVFIGQSTNIILGKTNNLGMYEADDEAGAITVGTRKYKLIEKQVTGQGVEFATTFQYTQNHIENYLIPEFISMRNELLETKSQMPAEGTIVSGSADGEKLVYYTTLNKEDDNFGEHDTYKVFLTTNAHADSTYTEQVQAYNRNISLWEDALRRNEMEKLHAATLTNTVKDPLKESGLLRNESFDAGATIQNSNTLLTGSQKGEVKTIEWSVIGGVTGGFEVGGVGIEIVPEEKHTWSDITEDSEVKDSTYTVGYVLADADQGNYFSIDVIAPGANQGLVFRTRGGQSSCPYEGAELSKYTDVKGQVLSEATVKIENPIITIQASDGSKSINDIASGKEGTFTLKMVNDSNAGLAAWFQLYVDDDSNPDGLVLSVDGTPLVSPRNYLVTPGTPLIKTLKVRQSKKDVLNYKGVKLVLASLCQGDPSADMGWIAEIDSITVNFVPSSSDITMNIADKVVNTLTENSVSMYISEYDLSLQNFTYIQPQYRKENSSLWTTGPRYVIDTNKGLLPADDAYNSAKDSLITNKSNFTHVFSMSGIADGIYEFRTVTASYYNGSKAENSSQIDKIILDRSAPKLLGSPSPVNGILTPEGEISLLFNESIEQVATVEVKGILNGGSLAHGTGLTFDNNYVSTEQPLPLNNKSFSVGAWVKFEGAANGTIFSHGNSQNGLSVGFDASGKAIVKIMGTEYNSESTLLPAAIISNNEWMYLSFSYNNGTGKSFNLIGKTDNYGDILFFNNYNLEDDAYESDGRLYVGANQNKSGGFKGAIHDLTLWSTHRELYDLTGISERKSGNEIGLIGYWPMDEVDGTVAYDKARSRNLLLSSTDQWYVDGANYAVSLDGTSAVSLKSELIPIGKAEDFAIEFWFKGNVKEEAILFSQGIVEDGEKSNVNLSIGFDNTGKLNILTKGNVQSAGTADYLDGKWHHFALNVKRTENAIAYIDGKSVAQIPTSNIGGLSGSHIILGGIKQSNEDVDTIGNNFTGLIDDVRVWKATLNAEKIRLDRNAKLHGQEKGLLAYYPFEKGEVNGGAIIYSYSLANMVNVNEVAEVSGNVSESTGAMLKPARIFENVEQTYTTSDNKIVISLLEDLKRIEDCTLEITVSDISDLRGNPISGPVKWTSFVDMNRLKWSISDISVTQQVMNESLFSAEVVNQSGKEESYVLTNIPAWLSISRTQGTLKPLSSEKLTFTINKSTSIGNYETAVYLSGNNQIDEPFAISLKVTGEKPSWSVNPQDYTSSMNVIGQLKIENILSEDNEDIIAAFVDNTCVGIASPAYLKNFDSFYTLMDIYGNSTEINKEITFKVWDASSGRTYPVVTSNVTPMPFIPNKLYGTFENLVLFNAENVIEQNTSLNKGWTWLSVNVLNTDMSLANVFRNNEKSIVQIKDDNSHSDFNRIINKWEGDISHIDNTKMYSVSMQDAETLAFSGAVIKPSDYTISLKSGWTGIGYIPQFAMPLEEALVNLVASDGDIIKGQNKFAIYSTSFGGWIGSLDFLTPGQGYMYKSNMANQFVYSTVYSGSSTLRSAVVDNRIWQTEFAKYANNMSIIAKIEKDGINTSTMEVGVFCGDECRGSAITDENGLLFISVSGVDGEKFTFRVYDAANSSFYTAAQSTTFKANSVLGTAVAPFPVTFAITGIENNYGDDGIFIYLDNKAEKLYVNSKDIELENVAIIDVAGKLVQITNNLTGENTIDVSQLQPGVYTVVVDTERGVVKKKVLRAPR